MGYNLQLTNYWVIKHGLLENPLFSLMIIYDYPMFMAFHRGLPWSSQRYVHAGIYGHVSKVPMAAWRFRTPKNMN